MSVDAAEQILRPEEQSRRITDIDTGVRTKIASLEQSVLHLIEAIKETRIDNTRIWQAIEKMTTQMNQDDKTDWRVILAGFSLFLAIVIPVSVGLISQYSAIGMLEVKVHSNSERTNETIRSLAESVESLSQSVSTSNALVNRSIAESNHRIGQLEGQIHTLNTIITMTQSYNERTDRILWEGAFGTELPIRSFSSIIPLAPNKEE